jgi:hypothetical protein
MPSTDERLAALSERIKQLRSDVSVLTAETTRTRRRLHNLEGFAQAYLDTQKANRRLEDKQYRRLETRLQITGVFLTIAAVLSPLLAVLIVGR